jgi:hypothetical protein
MPKKQVTPTISRVDYLYQEIKEKKQSRKLL